MFFGLSICPKHNSRFLFVKKEKIIKNKIKQNNPKGFTLVEFLVVIVIVGILAAIALPQYRLSVDKSRYTALIPLAKSILNSQENFYMASGSYSENLEDLDINIPSNPTGSEATLPDGTAIILSEEDKYKYVKLYNNNLPNNYIMYQKLSKNFPNEIHCEAEIGNARAKRLCEEMGGEKIKRSLTYGYDTYVLQGIGNGKLPTLLEHKLLNADIDEETVALVVDAVTELRRILKTFAQLGGYPSLTDVGVPAELQASWAGTDASNPNRYVFSCSSTINCIANAANKNLPMFQNGQCTSYKKNAEVYQICEAISGNYITSGGSRYYTINSDLLEDL